jgi:small-conductance mechanosensitive channel
MTGEVQVFDWFTQIDEGILYNLLETVLLALALFIVGWLMKRLILGWEHYPRTMKRRWIVSIRNITFLFFILGCVIIWFEQLSALATTLFVIALAVVVATKELLQNFTGFLLKSGHRFFAVGDRIEVIGLRGNVIDQGMLGTTILEIDPAAKSNQYTGRAIFIPNATFLSHHVVNESYLKEFTFHIIVIPLCRRQDWRTAERILLQAANEVCHPFLEEVRTRLGSIETQHSYSTPAVEPRVNIALPEVDQLQLILRVPVPSERMGRTEQAIIRRYLELQEAEQPADSQ